MEYCISNDVYLNRIARYGEENIRRNLKPRNNLFIVMKLKSMISPDSMDEACIFIADIDLYREEPLYLHHWIVNA